MGSYFDTRSFGSDQELSISADKSGVMAPVPKVLVVDDSILVRKQINQILVSGGYDVAGLCIDGQEAVDLYKKLHREIDLVTMDISMPRMDGLKALELIMDFDKDAKVVMVSALGKEEYAEKALKIGAKSYIVKPLHSDSVIENLKKVLKSE